MPPRHRAYALAQPETAWAIYLARDTTDKQAPTGPQTVMLDLSLPSGTYAVEWLNPQTSDKHPQKLEVKAGASPARVQSPTFEDDVALAVRRVSPKLTPHASRRSEHPNPGNLTSGAIAAFRTVRG